MADPTPEDRDEASDPEDTATDARPSSDKPTSTAPAQAAAHATSPDDKPTSTANTEAAEPSVDEAAEVAAPPSKPTSDTNTTVNGGRTADSTAATATNDDADEDDFEAHHSPALIATAVALPVVLIVAVLVAAFIALRSPVEREPLALGPVPAPAADGPACQTLLPALPAELGDYTKATLVEPAPPATRAWQLPDGGDPITLRCGLDRPLEFNRASPLTVIDGVKWFQVRDEVAETGTWFAVDRETYIALTVPDGSGTSAVQTVSDTINANLPAREPNPGEL